MTRSTTAVIVLACAALAFGAGWFLRKAGAPAPAPAAEAPRGEPDPEPARAGEEAVALAETRKALAGERAQVVDLLAERDRLAAELRARKAEAAHASPEPDAPAAAHPAEKPRYVFRGTEKALAAISWPKAAEAVHNMTPLLAKWGASLEAGNPTPPELAEITRWNGPLVNVALAAQSGGLSGTGVNGAFTHPAIMVNLVHATLAEAGLPLSDAQARQLESLGQRFVAEDERREAGYDEGTFALQRTIDESILKDRLYAEIDKLVTDEQREVLHPESIRGRLSLDLFSSGVIWLTLAQPAPFKTREALVARLVREAEQHFDVPEEHRPLLEDAAAEWGRTLSDEYLDAELDALDKAGRFHIERVLVAARAQLVFGRAFVQKLPVDSPVAERVRAEAAFILPMRSP